MPIAGGPRLCKLALINTINAAKHAVIQLASVGFGSAMTIRYCFNDGLRVHGHYATAAEQRDSLIPNGNTFVVGGSQAPSGAILDACFDGQYYYYLTATQVTQRPSVLTSVSNVKVWNHGLANAAGIMTDGKNIIIMTA